MREEEKENDRERGEERKNRRAAFVARSPLVPW